MLHKFPNCGKRLQKWLEKISPLRALSLVDLSKLLVCHKHFEGRFLTKTGRLLGCAYPTLFSYDEISSGIPAESIEASENYNPNMDHNYSMKRHYDHSYARTLLSDPTKAHKSTDPIPSTSQVTEPVIDPVVEQEKLASLESSDEKKGRRFTLEDKLLALAIMKQGPRCYKFLQRIFILPSATTLKKLVKKLNVQPGLNPQIFECIKNEVFSWPDNKKYCSIIFDEMSLECGLTFNSYQDKINGFVHLTNRAPEFADHALCIIIKGAVYKWQQSALKSLQQDTRREQILSEDHIDETIGIGHFTLSVIYDPPHLIKGLRNNFLTKNISFSGKRAKWSDIVEVYKTDCQHAESRLLHKLSDEHILPEKIKKMKVKNCVQVLSSTMLYTSSFAQYCDGNPVSGTLKHTAEVVIFLDNLFDSVNGVCTYNKKREDVW
ncbi:unnamed protein product, partial [Iphiclides podalirius]